ncbi:hypothetical protein [Nocardia sp. NPDC055049]
MTDAGTPERVDATDAEPDVPLAAGDDVVSAAQILVSYLWNSEYEGSGETQRGHIWQQLRTLTCWLTSPPRD